MGSPHSMVLALPHHTHRTPSGPCYLMTILLREIQNPTAVGWLSGWESALPEDLGSVPSTTYTRLLRAVCNSSSVCLSVCLCLCVSITLFWPPLVLHAHGAQMYKPAKYCAHKIEWRGKKLKTVFSLGSQLGIPSKVNLLINHFRKQPADDLAASQ